MRLRAGASIYVTLLTTDVALFAVLAIGCSYRASFRDCDITCASPTDCPEDLTCGSEGLCRASGVTASCAAVRDARDSEDDAPKPIDAPAIVVDAKPDAPPLGPPEYYGCFAVADNTYNCTEICASEAKTCSTGCTSGKVYYAYSLAGPCAASQPTSFTSTSCTQKAVLGTGDTIYVQCCCQ
jgi:hypothetical protein